MATALNTNGLVKMEKDLLRFLKVRAKPSKFGSVSADDVYDYLNLRSIMTTTEIARSLINRVLNENFFRHVGYVKSKRYSRTRFIRQWTNFS